MPDLTIYRSDAEAIIDIVLRCKKLIHDIATVQTISDVDYAMMRECDHTAVLFSNRLVQGLHPEREQL